MNNITTAAKGPVTWAPMEMHHIRDRRARLTSAPERNIVPGPPGAEFPPVSFTPGEVGDKDYSPYVRIANGGGVVYNADR